MASAWTGHFYTEAQSHKMIYDQVSQTYEQHETHWKALNIDTANLTEVAEVIRWANAMAKESFSSGYSFFIKMIEHQKEGSIFGVKNGMFSLKVGRYQLNLGIKVD